MMDSAIAFQRRRRRRRCRPEVSSSSSLPILLFLLCHGFSLIDAQNGEPHHARPLVVLTSSSSLKHNNSTRGSRTMSSSKAAAAAAMSKRRGNHRMSEQPTLCEYMESLLQKESADSDFVERLQQQQHEQTMSRLATSVPQQQQFDHGAVLMLSSIVFMASASAFLTPKLFVDTLTTAASSLAVLVPWMWLGHHSIPTTAMTRQYLWVDILAVFQIVSQQRFQNYVATNVLPLAWETLHKMLIMEAWKRVWRMVSKQINVRLFPKAERKRHQQHRVWNYLHSFLDTAIKRGSQATIRKSIERNVQATLQTALERVAQYGEYAVATLLVLPAAGGGRSGMTGDLNSLPSSVPASS